MSQQTVISSPFIHLCAISKPEVSVLPLHETLQKKCSRTYIPIFVRSHITWLVSSFVPWPTLLPGIAPSTHRMSVKLIKSEHFVKEGEWYICDPPCGQVVYRQCCCPTYKLLWWSFLSYFVILCCCCHMFGSNSVACCFSALFIILAGFAAFATVCDPTWRSEDQTLSTCLTGCYIWPVALCLLRFEEKCVNDLSYRSIKIHMYSTIAPANAAHQYIFK